MPKNKNPLLKSFGIHLCRSVIVAHIFGIVNLFLKEKPPMGGGQKKVVMPSKEHNYFLIADKRAAARDFTHLRQPHFCSLILRKPPEEGSVR